MFRELLNRDMVLWLADTLQDGLKAQIEEGDGGGRRGAADDRPEGTEDLTPEDYQYALGEIAKAREEEQKHTSGQPGFDGAPSDRRGDVLSPLDDVSFFSRDPILSNVQSGIEQMCEDLRGDLIQDSETQGGRRSGDAPDAVSPRGLALTLPGDRRVGEQFSVTDIRWANSLIAKGISQLRGKHAFNEQPAAPLDIADNARVVMLGDWGSGIPRAIAVANQIRAILDEGKQTGREQHVVHLGDVYYSGWKREYEKRFLAHWPVRADEAGEITSWSTNANHDMYSGGHAYYQVLLGDNRFARQERSSFFSLRNAHWNLLALDTAYDDHELRDPQAAWVEQEVNASDRKVMLLSHHQPFSAYEGGGPKLIEKLKPVLDAGRVTSWYWGHEHRCMLYKPHMGVQFGRCIGHAGVPVYMRHAEGDPIPEPGVYEYRDRFNTNLLEPWARFGFAVMDFDGPRIQVRYINEEGIEHKSEVIA